MKKTLLTLSVFGLCATQVSASVEAIFSNDNSGRIYSTATDNAENTSDQLYVSSDDEISLAIQNLSAQAQQKEDHLSALADRLSAHAKATEIKSYPAPTPSYSVAGRGIRISSAAGSSAITSSAPPAIAAARASSAAHSSTIGLCAKYVRRALQAAGYNFTPNPSAYQYATRGTLAKAGFAKVSNNTSPQVGDVVVYNRSRKHPHGHIQIFDGNNWISDFRQVKKSPYSNHYSYTTWRDARYLNDASNKGIYLAMGE